MARAWAHPIAGRILAALTALLVAAMLTACGGGSKSLESGGGGVPGPKGKSVPPIAIVSLDGIPETKAQILKEALSEAGGNRDMAIVEGAFDDGTLGLTANFSVLPSGGGTSVTHNWTLADKSGAVLATHTGQEQAPPATGADPWSGVTPAVLQRIAAEVARSLAQRLSEQGYATQVGMTLPPAEGWQMATAEDAKKLDHETLYGPGYTSSVKAEAPAPTPLATASTSKLEPPKPVQQPQPRPAQAAEEAVIKKKPAKAAGKAQAIRAVAVLPVSGAPGSGNGELTGALRKVLKGAGWPVVGSPQPDALTISGAVKIMPPKGNEQKVALAWTVKSPDGRVIGTIKQANAVPAGSLDRGWGDNADQAAEAAAVGIFNLVKKLR
jgi:hypothetical protein